VAVWVALGGAARAAVHLRHDPLIRPDLAVDGLEHEHLVVV
jgi:hypothetical protein